MSFTPEQIIALLIQYKYLILFPAIVLEGPIATLLAGFLSSLGYFYFLMIYLIAIIADVFGDVLYYALGRWGGTSVIKRWGRYFKFTENRLNQLEQHFYQHAGKTLLLGKLAHGIGGAILVAAGTAKMPLGKFIWYNFLGTLPKSLILLLIGYYFGKTYAKFSTYLDYTALGTAGLTIFLLLLYLSIKRLAKKTL